jgi:16S rRNA (cytidine1402-2'-O)-methyltransferase
VVSGFPLIPLTIFGFPPRRSKDRKLWFDEIAAIRHTMTFFESPHRVAATLEEASELLGERPILIGRELTKVHQEFLRGTAQALSGQLRPTKGEITVVVGPACEVPVGKDKARDTIDAIAYFGYLTDSGGSSRRAALTAAAHKFGLSTKALYLALEKTKPPTE